MKKAEHRKTVINIWEFKRKKRKLSTLLDIQKKRNRNVLFPLLLVENHLKYFKRNFDVKNFREWHMIDISRHLYILFAEGTAIFVQSYKRNKKLVT